MSVEVGRGVILREHERLGDGVTDTLRANLLMASLDEQVSFVKDGYVVYFRHDAQLPSVASVTLNIGRVVFHITNFEAGYAAIGPSLHGVVVWTGAIHYTGNMRAAMTTLSRAVPNLGA